MGPIKLEPHSVSKPFQIGSLANPCSSLVPNSRIGGAGSSTKFALQGGLDISPFILSLCCDAAVLCRWTPCCPAQFSPTFDRDVPKRRIGGSGTSTPYPSHVNPSQGRDSSKAPESATAACCLAGVCKALGLVALLGFLCHTAEEHHSQPKQCNQRPRGAYHRGRAKLRRAKGPASQDTIDAADRVYKLAPCALVAILGISAISQQALFAADDWICSQASSIWIVGSLILLSSLLCCVLRAVGANRGRIGRGVLFLCGDSPANAVVGFGSRFSVQGFVAAEKPKPHVCCIGPAARIARLILIILGIVDMPQVFAMQAGPALYCPLSVVGMFLPDVAQAMVAPDRMEGAPRVNPLRPHEQPVEQLADHLGPALRWPIPWQLLPPSPRTSTPRALMFDEARNPGTYRQENGEVIKWLGVMLYTPNMQPIPMALREQKPSCLQYYLDVVVDAAPGADPLTYKCCVPIVPQQFSGSCTLLRYPCHIKEVEGISLFAVILDLTTVGGHYFACVLPGPIPFEDLVEYVLPQTSYDDAPLRFFIGDSSTPHPERQPVELYDGVVIFACRPVFVWRPLPTVESIVEDPDSWRPLNDLFIPTPYRGTLVQYRQKQYFLPSHHHTGSTVIEAASDMFKLRMDGMTTCASTTPGLELQGRACSHILLVLDLPAGQLLRPLAARRRDIFVLCDFRALGSRVWLHHAHVHTFHFRHWQLSLVLTSLLTANFWF